ncbi:MATE family efflux transporter [Xenorhabdus nematophila]|uniref:Multidrug resistance protein MdtK n=1 Tax=Xenorhabdus nematophila (strain ATCC 19061 / DSM 3370 / CCUG 14189 / LMG 1036 / NCIMB 9965 / AN6) TaxID=406817 RepID=D3VD65_XENNA|nr:MATE family efflux transporter [Xenorhabdus nematophila]CEE93147.1 multidrug transport protein (MATE family) [Xenorhabdus nematophila str. Anatoliense]CBJ89931.1 multidrug transport protein (MATE family) [Xenorhabdus nematophila ATCC 19061]CCW30015.1 Multidrug resistance protein MdtK [Xenorhabdus nematophila F1]CEE95890.1 multidrug transport protein (MATE family) [Xenorhabdus nematophila str. Anatoliense]CEK22810.1 multidrug transport protein (MATE family) [Xenorhabdus nematophila AN6/1]
MQKYLNEARSLLALGIPVIIAQFSQTAMGFVDTVMAGKAGAIEMSAVAIGTSIWLPTILFGQGILLALTPIVAHMNGSSRRNSIAGQIQQGFWLATFLSILVIAVLYNSQFIIAAQHNIDPLLAQKASEFIHAIMWGAPGCLFYQVLRSQCEGLSKTKPAMIIGILGLLVNIPVNYIFIYGKFGAPELGGVGCGVATATVYWVMFFLLLAYVKHSPTQKDIQTFNNVAAPKWHTQKRIMLLGLPIALAMFFEVTLFAVVSLLVSPLGVVAVAGHQIALNFSSMMFMFPMSLGIAATIRIGYNLGKKSTEGAKISAYTSLIVGLIIACVTATFTVMFSERIAFMYNDNSEVVILASHLMLLAAIYQLSDAVQVIGSGVLRGYKDTRSIFYITLISYWLFGLTSGYILALTDYVTQPMGPQGFWIGFIIGLTAAAFMMGYRIWWTQKQPVSFVLERSSH